MESSSSTSARPRRGAELELRIDSLAYGGAGVARTDGYVVFVRDAIPGDRVRARVTKSKRSFAEADSVELLEAMSHTNREIASTLVISIKTVGVHVSHILRKLDAPNRQQAAAIAHRLTPGPAP